jgi:cysteine-rich repeat protein
VCTVDDACKDKACAPGAKKPCDDGNACTDDGCDAKSGCNSSPNAAACDDKNICTDKDTCGGGSCAGAPVVCDDKDPCTADNCSALKGCVFAPVAEKTDCAADGKSWCVGGKCVAKQTCGNGVVETGEDCDGGPNVGNGACSKACKSNCAALDFDGKGSQVNLGQPAQLDFLQTSGFTIEVWFQADPVVDGNGSLVALGEGTEAGLNRMIHIDVLAGRRLQFMIRGSKGTAASSSVISPNGVIKPGQWHHVAAVRDKGKTLRLYLNGVLLGSAVDNPGETAIPQSVSWRIGTSDDTPPYAFKGRVGEVRFWSTAVLASELVARMNQVLDPGKFNQLQVYLPMQEGAGQTVKDVTDAPISGALSVGVQWVNACRPVCTPGTTECLGDQIATCNGQGSGFAAVAACPAQAPFCLAGQCLAPQPSCEAHLQANPKTLDGLYPIDPDGAGPIAAANLFCDMKNGGWTLVGNYYDAAGDDMPNTTDFVVSGWQQTGSGKWDLKAATVDRAWGGGTGSAAVSLAFVEALGKAAGQKNLKMCFVHQDGYDTTCRASFDGSLTLLGGKAANPKLDLYAASPLPFSFGRLAGLAGSVDGYSASNYVDGAYCVVRKPAGVAYEFGVSNSSDAGFCEYPSGAAAGVWSLSGYGTAFRPEATNDNELGAGAVGNGALLTNPLTETYGFRLYIGPDATLGSKSNPAKSCKAILDAKASLGDGSYWLDPDGPGPNAAVQTWCDMTRDGGGWTLVGLVHRANSYNVSEPKAWFTAGNNAGALAFQQETIDASPSAYAATTWQALLGAAGQARFDLHAHLDPAVRRSWYKTAQWQGFAEWFNNDSNASQVCTNVAMSQNCSSGTIGKVVNDRTELTGMNLNHYGYQTDCPLHLRLDSDLGASFSAVCSCTTNYNNNAWPDSGGDGHWGNGLRIWLRETVCGDGQTTVGEQCDDGNTAANDGCSATCQVEAMASCKDILAKFPAAPSGTYSIDPDGPGGAAAFAAACDMTTDGGGWTRLVAPMAASLKAGVDRAYLYSYNGRWYRSPKTQLVWGWASGQQLTGDYAWWNGSQAGSLTCNGSGEKPTFGIGCSNGGGGTAKVLLAYASDPNTGTGTVCQDIPNAFGGSVCQAGVATWVR